MEPAGGGGRDSLTANGTVLQKLRIFRQLEKKWPALLNILRHEVGEGQRALVFCNTKYGAAELCACLVEAGYSAEAIHGDRPQVRTVALRSDTPSDERL